MQNNSKNNQNQLSKCNLPEQAVFNQKNGIKLEKNSVIKMGRVRLRVRDIDYCD